KAQPLGGIDAVLEIAKQAELDVVVSSALDTSVGLAQAAALASALPQLPYACGLSTATLFANDICAQPLLATAGYLPVRRVEPDHQKLETLRPREDRVQWWMKRLENCYAELTRG